MQELFQDAAQNQYFALGEASPMVLLDVDFWTTPTPAWPLLDAMRRDTDWGRLVALVDTPEAAIAHLRAHAPMPATTEPWSFCVAHCGAPTARPDGGRAARPERRAPTSGPDRTGGRM